jgi:glycosyltransferase involved in cell wall biosynthesis
LFWLSGWIKMTLHKPKVSVILPVHRDDDFANAAILSILNQEFEDLEILLIGNNDIEILKSFQNIPRVRIIKAPHNFNLSEKLNLGIEAAYGKYLARMDSDDISHADRISKQVTFMDEHEDIDILGTGIRLIGSLHGSQKMLGEAIVLPSNNEELLLHMLNKNPFFHPTVMFRANRLKSYGLKYRKLFNRSQDYDLWTRAAGKLRFSNLQEPLLDYRLHNSQSGVLDANDSNYYSDIAKLTYCLKCIFSFDYRSLKALRIFPFRLRHLWTSWNTRRNK